MVLGRSSGCDIGLVSPEVAPVHCILVNLSTGWRIRDCSGRATRVNGQAIVDEPLRDGDTIQIGTFSFEVYMPAAKLAATPAKTRSASPSPADQHLKQSRRRFAERALRLRARLREELNARADAARRQAEMDRLEARLRAAHQEHQAQLAQERRTLAEQRGTLDARQQDIVHRAAELDCYARHLRRQEERAVRIEADAMRQADGERAGFERDLIRQRVELERQSRELNDLRAELVRRHADIDALAERLEEGLLREREQLHLDREQVACERAYLDQQRQEVIRMRAELERLRAPQTAPPPEPACENDTQIDTVPPRRDSGRHPLGDLARRSKRTGEVPRLGIDRERRPS
jgi:hypothetical protein